MKSVKSFDSNQSALLNLLARADNYNTFSVELYDVPDQAAWMYIHCQIVWFVICIKLR